MKRLFAIVMCIALVLAMAACSKKASSPLPSIPDYLDSAPAGVLFVSIGAEFKVIYDEGGLVMAVDSAEGSSEAIVNAYMDAVGSPCDTVVAQLTKRTIEADQHGPARVVVLKQAPSSATPSAKFLEDVRVDAAAATDFEVVMIAAKDLSAEGFISKDAAKDILTRQMKLVDVTVNCSEVEDSIYTLTFEEEGAEREYKMDASTGSIYLEVPTFEINDPTVDEELEFQVDYPEDEEPGFNPDGEF